MMQFGFSIFRYSMRPCILMSLLFVIIHSVRPPGRISSQRNFISKPVGGSHCEKCLGFVHISNTVSIGAANERLMTNCSLPVDFFSRYSASRSHVDSPLAF